MASRSSSRSAFASGPHRRAALAAVAVALAAPAASADTVDDCVAMHQRAQERRRAGSLRAAREQLLGCAAESCPAAVRDDCARWLGEVDRDLPTVVFAAQDAAGHDLAEVAVRADGQLLVSALDGAPRAVDPGTRRFVFERRDGAVVDRTVVIAAGEKNRSVVATFDSPRPAPRAGGPGGAPSAAAAPSRAPSFIALGVAGASLASFALFAIAGQRQFDHLKGACAPDCTQEDRDSVASKLLVADVSLALGLASLGIAALLYPWSRGAVSTSSSSWRFVAAF